MIDLAAVAARIDALDGWSARLVSPELVSVEYAPRGTRLLINVRGMVELTSEVLGFGRYDGDLMPLLPVLRIVAEARGE